ncbi:SDR family oxidoreductase [Paraneptunicella aestuarii]|uniref:SDR family NAD(P)-dependent oxidoreductase n=1 Tax=Paraneptunicella aestuarii TaxID=2831148 RepID=UPI001E387D7C|nr:SDR family oxidoreductase [Paraneptunicella aestuarii]UAA38974.1 SDR family oxidoreductase [Paraneptunicella aestuarii]
MKTFTDKVVVVTGAGSGIGRATALAFAKKGALLAVCDKDAKGLDETAKMLTDISAKEPLSVVLDITDAKEAEQFAEEVKSRFGGAHILVNNAGIEGRAKPVWATEDAVFRRVMEVNYFAVVRLTQLFLPHMRARNEGVIVNVSSIFGLIGTPNHADYCASKFAVRGFTEALMCELQESPIQVHLLHPGGIATNIAQANESQPFAQHFLKTPPEQLAEHLLHSISKNKPRIVYGSGAFRAWLGTRLLPLGLQCKAAWLELKKVIDLSDYPRHKQ